MFLYEVVPEWIVDEEILYEVIIDVEDLAIVWKHEFLFIYLYGSPTQRNIFTVEKYLF